MKPVNRKIEATVKGEPTTEAIEPDPIVESLREQAKKKKEEVKIDTNLDKSRGAHGQWTITGTLEGLNAIERVSGGPNAGTTVEAMKKKITDSLAERWLRKAITNAKL